jgi:hypothetical protein
VSDEVSGFWMMVGRGDWRGGRKANGVMIGVEIQRNPVQYRTVFFPHSFDMFEDETWTLLKNWRVIPV